MSVEYPGDIYQIFSQMITKVESLLVSDAPDYASVLRLLRDGEFAKRVEDLANVYYQGDLQGVTNAMHDLKSPLATIVNYLDLITDTETSLDQDTREVFIETVTDKWQLFKNGFDALSKYDPDNRNTQLATFISRLIELFPNINITTDYGQLTPEEIDQLQTVLPMSEINLAVQELLNNSRKHSAQNVIFRLRVAADRLVIEVEDDGTGVHPGRLSAVNAALERGQGGVGAEVSSRDSTGNGLTNIQSRGVSVKLENLEKRGARQTLIVPLGS